jgi:hypothetical protein
MKLELRQYIADEVRIEENDEGPMIRSSIKFNSLSVPLGYFEKFREKIAPTAFDGVLNDESREVLAFWNHNPDMPIGRRTAKTLEIDKTATLFKATIRPGNTSWGTDAVKSIQRGDVNGLSFGFRVYPKGEDWSEDEEGNLIRELLNVELIEVSPTPMPAYPKSSATVRSMEAAFEQYQSERAEKLRVGLAAISGVQVADRQRRDRLQREHFRLNTKGAAI